MRILITGSRHWDDEDRMRAALLKVNASAKTRPVLVHGDCGGADKMAARIARELGWEIESHPAEWKTYGKAAGMRRNAEMVALGADLCLAFPTPASIGTYGCMEMARKAGIKVIDLGEKVWNG